MIWLLGVVYHALRWIGAKAGLRFEGRLSSSARQRALDHVERSIEFGDGDGSVPPAACTTRVALPFDNRSSARLEVVGVHLRIGRSPVGGTVHRLAWSAAQNGPRPADLEIDTPANDGRGRIAFDAPLPVYECLASAPVLWLDGSVRFRVERAGRARFDLGVIDAVVSPTAFSLAERELSRTERDRLAADRAVLRERLDSTRSASTPPAAPTDGGEGPFPPDRGTNEDR